MITPRDYQEESIEIGLEFFESKKKQKPSIFVAPVAAGKSIIIGGIASNLQDPTLVLQPSKELLEQNHSKLITFGGEASIFSASVGIKEIGHTTYATLGSIKKKALEFKKLGVKNVIIDECHMTYSPASGSMFKNFMDTLNPDKVLGFTATPIRLKQYGDSERNWSQLNVITRTNPKYFKEILHVVPISMMVERGYWSPLLYEQYDFDESTLVLNTTGSEYTELSIQSAIAAQGVNNNIYLRIKTLLKQGRKNILVFMDNVHNAQKMADLFGDIAACVHGGTKKKDRSEIIEAFKHGDIKIVTNFGTLTTGFDHPQLDTIILGRPTNSLALYYQMTGRGTRIHDLKKDCLIIDFCNNTKRFGKLETLNYENIGGFGWGMFTDDRLLTGIPMGDEGQTKEEIYKQIHKDRLDAKDMELWFGKHKGKRISEIPSNYLKWAYGEWDFGSPKMIKMKAQIQVKLVEKGLLKIE